MIQQNGRLQLHEGKWVWFIMGVTNAFDPSCPSFSCEIDLSMLLEFEQGRNCNACSCSKKLLFLIITHLRIPSSGRDMALDQP